MAQNQNKVIAKNTVFLYIRMMLTMLVTLFTSRIILNALGAVDYGLNNIISGTIVLFSFINGSLAVSTSRFLTFELGNSNIKKLQAIFSTALFIHSAFAMIVVLLGESIGLYLINYKLVIPSNRILACNIIFQCAIFSSFLTIIQVPFNSLIIAHERMKIYAYLGLSDAILKLAIAYIILKAPFDKLITLGICNWVITFLMFMFYFFYCKKLFKECVVCLHSDKPALRQMLGFSFWSIFGSFASLLKDQGLNILMNIFFGPTVNAANAIAQQVNRCVMNFTNNFTIALNPQIIKSYSSGDNVRVRFLLFVGGKVSFFLLMLISIPILIYCHEILLLWLKQIPEYSVYLTQLVIVVSLVECFVYTMGAAIQATGRIRNYQIIISLIQIISFPISYALYALGYSPGAAFIAIIVLSLIAMFCRLYFLYIYIGITALEYSKNVILRCFITFGISLIIPLYLKIIFPPTILCLLCICLVSIIISLTVVYLVGLSNEEKIAIIENTRRFKFSVIIKFLKILSLLFFVYFCISLMSHDNGKQALNVKNVNIHFSYDDVWQCLDDITVHENEYNSLFENSFFAYLREKHKKYGSKFTLYVYEKNDKFRIDHVTDKFKKEFQENSDWLKFAFHASTASMNMQSLEEFEKSYNNVCTSITKFAGNKSVAHMVRLHGFQGDRQLLNLLKPSTKVLLTADDSRLSYDCTSLEVDRLNSDTIHKNGLVYCKTDLRFEKISDYAFLNLEWMNNLVQKDTIVVFTHEWLFNDLLSNYKIDKFLELTNGAIYIN